MHKSDLGEVHFHTHGINHFDYHYKTDERPSKLARVFMAVELESQWATCQRGRVGSAIVTHEFQILLLARNGTPRNQPHCRTLTNPNERCQFCIHSETNLVNRAARSGLSIEGLTLVTLKRPCLGCSNNIVEANIGALYYREDYDTDEQKEYVLDMFAKKGIFVAKVPMSVQEHSFSILLESWRETWTSHSQS